jgi:hypothetical protein
MCTWSKAPRDDVLAGIGHFVLSSRYMALSGESLKRFSHLQD